MIAEKYRFILFGRYPFDEQWRPALVVALFIALYAVSAMRAVLAQGAAADLGRDAGGDRRADVGRRARPAYVPQDSWGGLPITLILATFGLAFAFPLAVLVALGRRSTRCRR